MGLAKLPRQLPPLSAVLQDLGARPPAIARALGLSERTVWRYVADDDAPRPVLLALFWLSSWGWSMVEADARQAIDTARALADALARENALLRAEIGRLQALGDFGSANDTRAWPIVQQRPVVRAVGAVSVVRHRVAVGPQFGFEADQARLDAHDPSQVRAE